MKKLVAHFTCLTHTWQATFPSVYSLFEEISTTMFSVILYQPEIPPNTGNIIRLCANTGCELHLIEPLGFTLNDKDLKRAGLDYHALTRVQVHQSLQHCLNAITPKRLFALSTKGSQIYSTLSFAPNDCFLFGSESKGLPTALLETLSSLKIPQAPGARSINLSNAVAIVLYEAWRQNQFLV